MKKLGLIALVTIVSAATALAGTVVIPFFVDTAGVDWSSGTGTPSSPAGDCSFLWVKNTTGSSITCTVAYRDSAGNPDGPTPVAGNHNTFVLAPFQGIGWRPGNEDPTQENAQALDIGNMDTGFPNQAGSATITWTGPATDIVASCRLIGNGSEGLMGVYGPFLGF